MEPIAPTLDDNGVMDFVATGLVVLEGLISADFNRRCDDLAPGNCDATSPSSSIVKFNSRISTSSSAKRFKSSFFSIRERKSFRVSSNNASPSCKVMSPIFPWTCLPFRATAITAAE